jgi:hypothetical protein
LSLSGLFACMFFSSNNNTAFAQQQRQLLFSLTSLEDLKHGTKDSYTINGVGAILSIVG